MEKCSIAFIKMILKNTREFKASQPCLRILVPISDKSLFGKKNESIKCISLSD